MIFQSYQNPNHISCILSNNSMGLLKKGILSLPFALENSFFMLLTVFYLGHEIGSEASEPIQFEKAATHKIQSLSTDTELMRLFGSFFFYFKLIDNLHVHMKHLYDLLQDNVNFHWNKELDTLFQQAKTSFTKNVTLLLLKKIIRSVSL